jgi:hypothetical protein
VEGPTKEDAVKLTSLQSNGVEAQDIDGGEDLHSNIVAR